MRRTTSTGIALSLVLVAVAPTRAADLRSCDWVGPGGRAIYRCGLDRDLGFASERSVKEARVASVRVKQIRAKEARVRKAKHVRVARVVQDDPPLQRSCDWLGPGGRALYRCSIH